MQGGHLYCRGFMCVFLIWTFMLSLLLMVVPQERQTNPTSHCFTLVAIKASSSSLSLSKRQRRNGITFNRQISHHETVKINALPIFVCDAHVTVNGSPVGELFAARRAPVSHSSADVHFAQVSPDAIGGNGLCAKHADVPVSVTPPDMSLHQLAHRKVLKT